MKIILPKGYQPPEGARPGEPFEVVAILTASDDGSFQITALDGVKLGEDEEPPEEEEVPEMENPFDSLDEGALSLSKNV